MAEEPLYQSQTPLEEPSYSPVDHSQEAPAETEVSPGISWTASEYIAHHKTTQWYVMLGGAALVVALLVWLLTRDKISALVVIVGAIALGGYGARQPRELQYSLDVGELTIGQKQYDLQEFRSFTIDDQQQFSSVNLLPLKRFSPGLTIYYAPEDEDAIIDVLSQVLPIETHQPDLIDRLMQRIRF